MILLSIETSCDETAISIIKAEGDFPNATYTILGNALFSQIDAHKEFGGVFPAVAKREHIATILPMLEKALKESGLAPAPAKALSPDAESEIYTLLYREEDLAPNVLAFNQAWGNPGIDAIAVTSGPGLEPALWVGINFAKALSALWQIPVVPVDHMEGHILASVFKENTIAAIQFPALALLVSGGHTELILMEKWGHYTKVGQTRDDAVGEAFDKVARLIGLPYPGGPEIGRLAAQARAEELPPYTKLPQPMLHSGDLDFSFSGLKTAVRYAVEGKTLTDGEKMALARDFEDAAVGVLVTKSMSAIKKYDALSFILGGGVSANHFLRAAISAFHAPETLHSVDVYLPDPSLSTDNSIMIGLAGHARIAESLSPEVFTATIKADGNRSLDAEAD